jgi:DNA repair protein RecN (Recombination protein N)
VTLTFLLQTGAYLVDIHGQHSQQQLLHARNHLDFLDRYGSNQPLIKEVASACRKLEVLRNELKTLERSEQDRLQRLDLLRYQIEEIDRLKLVPAIDVELKRERDLLNSAERRYQAAQEVHSTLYEDDLSALSLLDQTDRSLELLATLEPSFQELRGRLSEARFQLEELAFTCRDYGAGIEFNSNRLEQLEERLAEIDNAKRKYGGSVDQILEYYESIVSEVALLENREVEVSRLSAEIESVREIYLQRAAELSDKRHRDALELAEAVSRELRDLAMKNTVFRVHLWPLEDEVTEKGSDGAEFLISPNVGEEPRPLARIASGGELSRVMLALKSVLKNDDQAKTLVFDEVDAGIGGRTARSLGEKLSRLSQNHQIFCVTHLPQVAAFARQHFYVQKRRRSGRTVISISSLAPDARIEELSRMLAGDAVTQTTRQQAQELLHSSE